MRKPKLLKANEVEEYRLRWAGHLAKCADCQKYQPGQTASLRHVCPEGAPLIRELLVWDSRPERLAELRKQRGQLKDASKERLL